MNNTKDTAPKKYLSLFDSTCIIVGIIIGAGIYEVCPTVAAALPGPIWIPVIWLAGGLLALSGAFCYAELATAYPREGGDYVYLSCAYGRSAGFLFGWSQLAIIRPGDIALMAFIFGRYAAVLYKPFNNHCPQFYAAVAVVILTTINIISVKQGKWTQNFLTIIKTTALVAIVASTFLVPSTTSASTNSTRFDFDGVKLAMILVLFAFGGWNEMAYVAAEIKKPEQNILRALVIGTISVTVLYIIANCAFLHALGYEKMIASEAVAVDTIAKSFPSVASRAIATIICISALGAVNGLIFTGARISYAIGSEHKIFRLFGTWNKRSGTPICALICQGALSLLIILLAGSFIDTILYSAPVVWLFFLATCISVFVLRQRQPSVRCPYKVIGYPVTVVIFAACCIFMFYGCITYAWSNTPKSLIVLSAVISAGIVLYLLTELSPSRKKPLN